MEKPLTPSLLLPDPLPQCQQGKVLKDSHGKKCYPVSTASGQRILGPHSSSNSHSLCDLRPHTSPL